VKRPIGVIVFETASIAVWIVLWIALANRFTGGPALGAIVTVFAVIVGIIGSDLMSGFLHWFFDTFLEETTPIIGRQLISPFREHHRDPLAMTRHGAIELLGNSCAAFLWLMTIIWWFGPVIPRSPVGTFGYLAFLSFCFALTASNQLHCWAHDPAPPLLAKVLQALGLAVSPAHHSGHHVWPHRNRFCVTTGWANYAVDGLRLSDYNERLFVAVGIPRKSDNHEEGGEEPRLHDGNKKRDGERILDSPMDESTCKPKQHPESDDHVHDQHQEHSIAIPEQPSRNGRGSDDRTRYKNSQSRFPFRPDRSKQNLVRNEERQAEGGDSREAPPSAPGQHGLREFGCDEDAGNRNHIRSGSDSKHGRNAVESFAKVNGAQQRSDHENKTHQVIRAEQVQPRCDGYELQDHGSHRRRGEIVEDQLVEGPFSGGLNHGPHRSAEQSDAETNAAEKHNGQQKESPARTRGMRVSTKPLDDFGDDSGLRRRPGVPGPCDVAKLERSGNGIAQSSRKPAKARKIELCNVKQYAIRMDLDDGRRSGRKQNHTAEGPIVRQIQQQPSAQRVTDNHGLRSQPVKNTCNRFARQFRSEWRMRRAVPRQIDRIDLEPALGKREAERIQQLLVTAKSVNKENSTARRACRGKVQVGSRRLNVEHAGLPALRQPRILQCGDGQNRGQRKREVEPHGGDATPMADFGSTAI